MTNTDVLIIGGGAAGLMCAITAAGHGRNVIVLEGSNKIGKKILMSGGGRCNFTNLNCNPDNFISHNRQFCISALSRYTQHDFIALVEKHRIPHHEKAAGQLFCDNSSRDIVAMLQRECDDACVRIETHCTINAVASSNGYLVTTDKGSFSAPSLVIATGGLSIPKMGATAFGYEIARQFGLHVFETRAGLVPFTFTGSMHELTTRLSGVSIRASVTANGSTFTDDILFTHRGLSGPAILQISSYWHPGNAIEIDLLPDMDSNRLLLAAKSAQPRALLHTILAASLPRALVNELRGLFWRRHAETPLSEIGNDTLAEIAANLHCWRIRPAATEGYRTAEVTLGGVDTSELSSKTMEARKHPGLYFVGEVVDVAGHLGGFNFQWAWASGHAAGTAI